MAITLNIENFRCHSSLEIEFPTKGLVALSGQSGSGKSTVLAAIVWCLYGKVPGKSKKPHSHFASEEGPKVVLEYDQIGTVTRRAKPASLEVCSVDGKTYFNDEAQSVIISTLNLTYDEFLVSSYIVQRSNASVLSLPPAEQVKFIEVLSNSGAKAKLEIIKEEIRRSDEALLEIRGKVAAFESMLGAIPPLRRSVKVPKARDVTIFVNKIALLKNTEEKLRSKMEVLSTNIQMAKKKEAARRKVEEAKVHLMAELNSKNVQAAALLPPPERSTTKEEFARSADANVRSTEREVEEAKETLKKLRLYNRYIQMRDERYESLTVSLAKLNEELGGEVPSVDEIERAKEALATFSSETKKYEEAAAQVESDMNKLRGLFRTIKTMWPDSAAIKTPAQMLTFLEGLGGEFVGAFECPGCSKKCAIARTPAGEIVTFGAERKRSGQLANGDRRPYDLYQSVKETNDAIGKGRLHLHRPLEPDVTLAQIKAMEIQLSKYNRLMEKKEELERRLESDSDSTDPTGGPPTAPLGVKDGVDEASLEKTIEKGLKKIGQLKARLENSLQKEKDRQRLLVETAAIEDRISKLTLPPAPKKTSAEYEEMMATSMSKLVEISERTRELETDLRVADTANKQRETIKAAIAAATEEERLQLRAAALLKLLEAAKEAEVIALDETVRSINGHAEGYLERFFNEPISVRLMCSKTVGKGSKERLSIKLNTVVEYKGAVYSEIDELSGGERQRCEAAFVLAVNDMLGCKLLFLDECLNNLDADINMEMLGLLREGVATDRLVVVISHEAIEGTFDEVIPL